MSDAYAGRYFNYLTNSWESALGYTGAPRAQLWAYQPTSLSLQPVTLDNNGALLTSAVLSGSAGNAAAGLTGAAVPTSADYQGWNNAGTLVGTSVAAPLPVQVISGGGGGTQYADGATQATPTGTVALGKNPSNILHALGLDAAGNLQVLFANTTLAVTGTFFQATQPISAISLPLPTGAATSALQSSTITALGSPLQAGGSVSVSNFPATQAISAASLPLPTGAATSAKQPAIGTAGVSSVDVLSVQGVAGGTAVPVSGTVGVNNFPATQTVAGTVTANQGGTNWSMNVAQWAGAAPSLTNPVFVSPATGAVFWQATQPVSIAASVAVTGTFFQATQPVSIAAAITANQGGAPWTVKPDGTVWALTGTSANVAVVGSVAVTGTFFQATQPVSIAATVTVAGTVNTKTALTANSPAAVSVGTTSASAVATNANRKGLILTNLSSNTISLGFGAAAVLNSGITLPPYAVFSMDEYCFSTAAVNAIASVAASSLAVQEWQ